MRGEAGIGKSRLISEFCARAKARGLRVVTGWTREYANAPYAAFTEALEGLRVAPLPIPSSAPESDRSAWFGEVAQALRTAVAGENNGVVVALEDLQWADPATIDLLRFCASRLNDAPILFVASYRVDDLEPGAPDSARAFDRIEREADVVTLSPLAPGQIEHLIIGVLEGVGREIPPAVIADVRDLADGRPLFAEELLRGVFERLDRDERATPSVPSSIRATVLERFHSLDEQGQELLLHASVLGLRFSAARLIRLTSTEPALAYTAIRRARDLGLVVENPDDDDGDTFAFRHALTREAIYSEMLRAEARLRHAQVGRLLAEENPIDVAAMAEHTWRAGDGENAAQWNERAGDESVAFFAFAEAARAYERAHSSTVDGTRRARLAESAAAATYQMGALLSAARWFGEAAASRSALGERGSATRLTLQRARVLSEAGKLDDGLREAEAIAVSDANPAERFEVDTMIGGYLAIKGRVHEALERLRNADRYRQHADPVTSTRFTATYALVLSLVGPSDDARARFAETIASAEKISDLDMLLRTYNNWANFEVNFSDVTRARELYARGLSIADETKNVRHSVWLLCNAAIAALVSGKLDECEALLVRAEQPEHGMAMPRLWGLAARVRLATLRGEDLTAEADDAARELDAAAASDDARGVAMLGAALAYRAASLGNRAEAARCVRIAAAGIETALAPFWLLDTASRFGTPEEQRRARSRLTEIAERDGAYAPRGFLMLNDARDASRRRQREETYRLAEAAVENFTAAGWRLEEAFALEAAGRAAEALVRFREMGALGEVRRLTELASTSRRRGDATLTGREGEIASLLLEGRTARAIADVLVISERTVETHVAAIYRKLGVANRQQLATLLDETRPAPDSPPR